MEDISNIIKRKRKITLNEILNLNLKEADYGVFLTVLNKYGIKLEVEDYTNFCVSLENQVDDFLKQISNYPVLTPVEEKILFKFYKLGNEEARTKLINCNLKLVAWVATSSIYLKYLKQSSISQMDLIITGVFGLMDAIDRFDEEKGYRFSTYAISWIRQSIDDYYAKNGTPIKMSLRTINRLNKMSKFSNEFLVLNGREPNIDEYSKYLKLNKKAIKELQKIKQGILYLEEQINDDGLTLGDTISDNEQSINNFLDKSQTKYLLEEIKKNLTPKEYEIIMLRIGYDEKTMDFNDKKTLIEIGEMMGVTNEWVRIIEKKAKQKIKKLINTNETNKKS